MIWIIIFLIRGQKFKTQKSIAIVKLIVLACSPFAQSNSPKLADLTNAPLINHSPTISPTGPTQFKIKSFL